LQQNKKKKAMVPMLLPSSMCYNKTKWRWQRQQRCCRFLCKMKKRRRLKGGSLP
jgi:hypothetical protein